MSRPESDLNDDLAEYHARLRALFIPYPPHIKLHAEFDLLCKLSRKLRGSAQFGVRVLAPSGSGKTKAARAYRDLANSNTSSTDHKPVIIIGLEASTTTKKLMIQILDQFGDPHSNLGNELILKKRVLACFYRFKTDLLIVDEVQHLNYRNGPKNDVTDTLKSFLDSGAVSIAFLGTLEALRMFERNIQLNGRLRPPRDLKPLSAQNTSDQSLFYGFVSRLDQSLVDIGIFNRLSGLNAPDNLSKLFEVSNGVIGRVTQIVAFAMEAALRRRGDVIVSCDLSDAVEAWALEQKISAYNPFREERIG